MNSDVLNDYLQCVAHALEYTDWGRSKTHRTAKHYFVDALLTGTLLTCGTEEQGPLYDFYLFADSPAWCLVCPREIYALSDVAAMARGYLARVRVEADKLKALSAKYLQHL